MMIRDNSDMESKSDRSDCEGMPPLEDSDGDELALPVEESLVIRRTLQVQDKENETNHQREIFHTRCYVQSKVRGLIIDSGSCVNVCSTTHVSKLNLCTVKHAKPYRLQWLNDSGEVKVTKQVVVPFSIVMKFCVTWYQCKQVTSWWGDHGNMIGRQFMMGLKICIPL